MTHICVGNLTIIGSDNGLSPDRRQAIIWTSAGSLLIGPLGTNFSEILIGIQTFSFTKMHLKMSAKWRPFCPSLNVLRPNVLKLHFPWAYLCGFPDPALAGPVAGCQLPLWNSQPHLHDTPTKKKKKTISRAKLLIWCATEMGQYGYDDHGKHISAISTSQSQFLITTKSQYVQTMSWTQKHCC